MTNSQPSVPARLELPARVASGAVLVAGALAGLIAGGFFFAFVVVAGAVAALREWHRLVNGRKLARETFGTALAMLALAAFVLGGYGPAYPVGAIAAGAAIVTLSAAARRTGQSWPLLWHAFGALYIGLTVWSLIGLREDGPRGAIIVGALFVAVWAADTGALVFGRLIGGPKLAPNLSPNKTWAGFIAGTMAAGAAEALYFWFTGGVVLNGLFLGFFLGFTGHCGDLFESWVKRQFRTKNTGSLIPGHGGMLDRVDSLLFAAPAMAFLLYVWGVTALFGAGF